MLMMYRDRCLQYQLHALRAQGSWLRFQERLRTFKLEFSAGAIDEAVEIDLNDLPPLLETLSMFETTVEFGIWSESTAAGGQMRWRGDAAARWHHCKPRHAGAMCRNRRRDSEPHRRRRSREH